MTAPTRRSGKDTAKTAGYYSLLWVVAILFFLPILWIVMAAFKSNTAILNTDYLFTPTLDNIKSVFDRPNVTSQFISSLYLSIGSVILAVAVSFPAAYAFSRWKFAYTDFLMFLLLSTRMVPAAAAIVPMLLMFNLFGLRNPFGFFLLYTSFSIPFSVWILKGFIDGVSERFDETAMVNGASRLHVMFKVVLPQVKPGLVAAFIFNLIFVWNEYLFNFSIGSEGVRNVPYGIANGLVDSGGNVDWGFLAAMSSLYLIVPMLMIFLFQRYLLVGMTFGTVRGDV